MKSQVGRPTLSQVCLPHMLASQAANYPMNNFLIAGYASYMAERCIWQCQGTMCSSGIRLLKSTRRKIQCHFRFPAAIAVILAIRVDLASLCWLWWIVVSVSQYVGSPFCVYLCDNVCVSFSCSGQSHITTKSFEKDIIMSHTAWPILPLALLVILWICLADNNLLIGPILCLDVRTIILPTLNDNTLYSAVLSIVYVTVLAVTNRFRLLPSRWCRHFSPWESSVLCQWPSLGWCYRCACHFSVCQAISSLDVLWVVFPSPSCSMRFLLFWSLYFASHAHTMIVVFGSGPIW